MKNQKKFWLLLVIIMTLSLGSTLLGQEKETTTEKVVTTLQDWDFKKYEAAHKRAHMKMGEKQGVRNKRVVMREQRKKMKTRRLIQNLIIGGVAYYIGYEVGKDEMINKKKDKPVIWRDKWNR